MSRVEQKILDALKTEAANSKEFGYEPRGYDAYELSGFSGGTQPATRRTLANMTRRGLVTRKDGYGLRGSAFRYFLPA